MNNYKLQFKLKQHTPIIHFQHDQYGATFRASELKPKLDKFLIKIFEEKGVAYKEWLVGKGDHPALDYKLKITSESQMINGVESNKTFFGGMGHKGEKEYTWDNEPFDLFIFSINNELRKKIKEYFRYFLAETNFGTRQTKGNGSFYIDKSDTDNFIDIEKVLPSGTFYISITQTDDKSISQIIDYYYKRLKAGINLNFDNRCTGEYNKSFLFQYFNSLTEKGWEKRYIKEKFFGLYDDGKEKYFIRTLLGLPGSFIYKKTQEPCHKKADKKVNSTYEILDDYEIEVYHPEIERYKSPIIFKPIKYGDKTNIFILPQVNDTINTNKKFEFYKNIVLKTITEKNGYLFIKQLAIVPQRLGTAKSEIESFIGKLETQESKIDIYIEQINKMTDFKKKKKLTKDLNDYIKGQKNRFDKFISECVLIDNIYFPPKCEIDIPKSSLDLNSLIKKYNEDELANSFSVENINAKINKIN